MDNVAIIVALAIVAMTILALTVVSAKRKGVSEVPNIVSSMLLGIVMALPIIFIGLNLYIFFTRLMNILSN